MKPNLYNINSLLLNPVSTPLHEAQEKKTTLRTSAGQTAFVEAVQASLPGTASFNDAVSIIIDTVAHFSMHPFPEVPLGRARLLGLFAQHGIPGVHINKVLEKIGVPKAQPGALSNPDFFAEHCSDDDAYKLADFFCISRPYVDGTINTPYLLRDVNDQSDLSFVELWIDSCSEELQPQFTLIIYTCNEPGTSGTVAYLKREQSLDMHFVFNTYLPIGYFTTQTEYVLNKLYESLHINRHIRKFELTDTAEAIYSMRKGKFINPTGSRFQS